MSRAEILGDAISAALRGQVIGNRVVVLQETTSTNDVIAQIAAANREGLVVLAETQTAGRGQYGRRWESTPGRGLWFSVLLRPPISVAQSAMLTDLLARTVADTIETEFALALKIKPPNDIYIDGRKIAGVLVEMRVEPSGNYIAIAGVGLNVNQKLEDFPPELQNSAGSIALAAGREIDRQELAIALLRKLDSTYEAFTRGLTNR